MTSSIIETMRNIRIKPMSMKTVMKKRRRKTEEEKKEKSIYIIQFLHAGRILLTPPRSRH